MVRRRTADSVGQSDRRGSRWCRRPGTTCPSAWANRLDGPTFPRRVPGKRIPRNLKFSVGATIPRAHIEDLEVPLLPPAKQSALADILQRTADLQAAAEATTTHAVEVRQQLINGVVAGALDVTS